MEITVTDGNFEKPHIGEGLYHAELQDIKDIAEGQYGQRVALVFQVFTGKEQSPVELPLVVYKNLTPKSKLTVALQALGAKITPGKVIRTDDFIGRPCRVFVKNYTMQSGAEASVVEQVLEADEYTRGHIAQAKTGGSAPGQDLPQSNDVQRVQEEMLEQE